MSSDFGVPVQKGSFKKSIKLDFKELSKALMKGGVHAVQGEWKSTFEDGADLLASFGISNGLSVAAWNLIHKSLTKAIENLIKETLGLANDKTQKNSLNERINSVLEESSFLLNSKFFEAPDQSRIILKVVPEFEKWLGEQGINSPACQAIASRLPTYFTLALNEEWLVSSRDYEILKNSLDTPFTQANERVQRLAVYKSWLVKQVNEPMLGEPFGLEKLFVNPRAYFIRKTSREKNEVSGDSDNDQKSRLVVNLQNYLLDWINAPKSDEVIKLISGGPGSGKSSFAKMLAANIAKRNDIDVFFIPLHHFEPSLDLIDAVGKFIKLDGFIDDNPLVNNKQQNQLLIIFDGLDELAMQGKIAAKTSRDFVLEIIRKVERLNQLKVRLQVLITGRELVVQESEADFRKEGQIIHLLPYYVSRTESRKYDDPENLLLADQRDEWWKRYGVATGQKYPKLPEELAQPHLEEITSQPLLNYLVALSLKRGELKFNEETNLNNIYGDLLKAIYERGWSKHQHASIQGFEEKDFYRVLEEIAIATWHGDGRTTTARDIRSHCDSSGIIKLLDRFQSQLQGDPQTKVTHLLTAFYFRKSGHDSSGEETFEFTHKSFGEYLTVRRIVREIELMNRKVDARDSDPDEGWDEREALHRWLVICGPTAIDNYLWNFLVDEIRLKYVHDKLLIRNLQNKFCRLFAFMLQDGMPLDRISPRLRFIEERRYAENAESALLICLGIFSGLTREISRIDWKNGFVFGSWLSKNVRHSTGFTHLPIFKSLNFLDLSGCWLNSRYFWSANFEGSDLTHVNLVGSDCRYADFTDAILANAILAHANLHGANFKGAVLEGVNFSPISLPNSGEYYGDDDILEGANFSGLNLDEAKFEESDLRGANFEGASLRAANFQNSLLISANFKDADLEDADFSHADLKSANFSGANLNGVDFHQANKRNSNFKGTVLDKDRVPKTTG